MESENARELSYKLAAARKQTVPGNVKFIFTLPSELLGKLDALSVETGKPKSEILRKILGNYLSRRERRNG